MTVRGSRAWLEAACVAACILPAVAGEREGSGPAQTATQRAAIKVGAAELAPCPDGSDYYCGTLRRPLDPSGVVAGSIDIAYRWLPRAKRSEPSRGTLVGIIGGPGYGSTGSAGRFRALFGPLLETRDLLTVDARGTGDSGAILCEPLQSAAVVTAENVGACGRQLGERADLYGAQLASADMAAILDALGARQIDVYGESYGTFAAQVFARNYPDRVRTIVLDGVYDALSPDPWYAAEPAGLRQAFRLVCQRSPPCSGDPIARLAAVLAALRADPAAAPQVRRGTVRGPLVPSDLAFVSNTAAEYPLVFIEFDAALRAYRGRDAAPLVRIVEEAYVYASASAGEKVGEYSMGQLAATSCADLPQAYDMGLPPEKRQAAFESAIADKSAATPDLYAPFSVREWTQSPPDWSFAALCLSWPVASARHPQGRILPPAARLPDVPVLLLTGDLDTVTTVGEGDETARRFARAQRVVVPNAPHVVALYGAPRCTAGMVRDFIASAGAPVDTDCVGTMLSPPRLLPMFAMRVAEVPPAAMAGARAADLAAAAAALYTVADAVQRNRFLGQASGAGLRGGTFRSDPRSRALRLEGLRWTEDLAVSGSATTDTATCAVSSRLGLAGAATGSVSVAWQMTGPQGLATIEGTINGRRVSATVPAP